MQHPMDVLSRRLKQSLILIFLLLLTGCASRPIVVEQTSLSWFESKDVFVVNHGWHTGFVIPAKDIQSVLPELGTRFRDESYLEIGWGDKGFYQSRKITVGLTLQAIFWPTESVLHVVGFNDLPENYFWNSRISNLCLSERQYALLIEFIASSFEKTDDGAIITLRNGIYGDSQFYKGIGDYYLFNTCNKWTAKGLKSAGLDLDPTLKLTATSVMNALSRESNGAITGSCRQIRGIGL